MPTVSKALSLLDYFSETRPSIGLSEMARLADINKTTVYRLMAELQDAGFVEQHGPDRSYRLGAGILRLAKLREAAVPVLETGRILLQRLSDQTGETAHFSLLRVGRLVEMAHVHSTVHATRVVMDDVDFLSFNATSSGLAVLAFSQASFVDRVLDAPLVPHTSQTLTEPAQIRDILDEIKVNGFASSVGGSEEDVASIAAPFFDEEAQPIGAIAVAAPVTRMDQDQNAKIAPLVLLAGREMTEHTGGRVPAGYPIPNLIN